jgi:beta-glucosidase
MTIADRVPAAGAEPRYRDPSLPVAERVDDLLAQMSSDEKLAQLGSLWAFEIINGPHLDPHKAALRLAAGMGQITRLAGATNLDMPNVAALANEIQRFLVEETRLGIPAIVHEECLHGLLAREAVCFPQSIGMAAAWDPELIETIARGLGRQLRAAGAHQALSPILDVARDPRWGRIEETYGEDAYLVAELGAAYVRGLQGNGDDGVLATAKHLVAHGVPEGGLNRAPAHVGPRELRDVFLFPFEAAVRDAGLRSVMHAYEDVDGVPCVASSELFTTTLRDQWGFDGIVVSDYAGIDELVDSHAVVEELSQAAALALAAGIDVDLPSTSAYGRPLADALASGRVSEALVDRAVARVLRVKFELGLFERPYVDARGARSSLDGDRALARAAARSSIVLVENDGTLPLPEDLRRIAVIGPNADSVRNLLGDYSHVAHIETLVEMRDGPNPFGFPVPEGLDLSDDLDGRPTVLDAIRERCAPSTEVVFAPGCGVLDGSDDEIAEAVAVAHEADVAVLVVGEKSGLIDGCTCGEARDRLELTLPGRQEELVAAVATTGTPIVLILVAGRPLGIEAAARASAAVLHAWCPGDEGPGAIADILFGDANPGGKLPVTVPRHVGQVPIYYGHKPSGGRSHWHGEYVDGSHLPLWPFGHGLSYTRFALHGPVLDRDSVSADGVIEVSVEVENVGERDGDEVIQLYVRDREASVTRPVKELRGFRRVRLAAGERRRVTFRLAAEQLAFTDRDGRLVVEPGGVRLMIGTSSVDLPCQADVELTGETTVLAERSRYFTGVSVDQLPARR